jgi:hypothetical protein
LSFSNLVVKRRKPMKNMKKGIIVSLVLAVAAGAFLVKPAVRIDGALYKREGITEGVKLLGEERALFYREQDETAEKEIDAFIADQRSRLGNTIDPSVPANGLKSILQRKYEILKNQDAVYESRLENLMEKNRLTVAIPLVKEEKNRDELYTAVFIPQSRLIGIQGSDFDETALSLVSAFTKAYWNEYSSAVLRELEEKTNRFSRRVLENLAAHKPLDEGSNSDEIASIPLYYRDAVSRLNAYNTALFSQCAVAGDPRAVPVSIVRSLREEPAGGYDFDTIMAQALRITHNNIRIGFNEYYRSNIAAIAAGQIERMKANLTADKDIDKDFDKQEAARFLSYLFGQAESYTTMATAILERSLPNSGTAGLVPVVFGETEGAAFGTMALSPLAIHYIDVDGSLYLGEPLLAMERELASFKAFFASFKEEKLEQEAKNIFDPMISNMREHRDISAGVSHTAFSSMVGYLSAQAAKSETMSEMLLNQFRAEAPVPAAVSKTNTLASFGNFINVSLPVTELAYHNGLALDREAVRIITTGMDTVRSEWNRVDRARKTALMNKRLGQYRNNIEICRALNYGIDVFEVKEAAAWGLRQQHISRPLFASLLGSCAPDPDAQLESVMVSSNVLAVDISPLGIGAKVFNGALYDSTLVSGVEKTADTLPRMMVRQINRETVKAVTRQTDLFRKNGTEWSELRYKIPTRLGLGAAGIAENVKLAWAKMRSSEYEKKDVEGAMYLSYLFRDYRLDEDLRYELDRAVTSDQELFEALVRDFNDCALTDGGVCFIEGVTSGEKILNAALAVPHYINDVFPALLNTGVNVRFVEKESVNWAPVLAIQIAAGCIPGVGLAADLIIDTCIDAASCLIEQKLKQDEYAEKIAGMINAEEQKLLFIINKPIYGGSR